MTAHTCHTHCGRTCPPRLLMCPTCWKLVPKALGDLVYEAYNAGRRTGDHPNGAWMLAAEAAIELVHLATGRRFRAVALTQAMSYAVDVDGVATARAFAGRVLTAATGPIVAELRKAWEPLGIV